MGQSWPQQDYVTTIYILGTPASRGVCVVDAWQSSPTDDEVAGRVRGRRPGLAEGDADQSDQPVQGWVRNLWKECGETELVAWVAPAATCVATLITNNQSLPSKRRKMNKL